MTRLLFWKTRCPTYESSVGECKIRSLTHPRVLCPQQSRIDEWKRLQMKDLMSVEAKHRRYKSTISDVDKAEKEAVDEVTRPLIF